MHIREFMNERPALIAGLAVALILASASLLAWWFLPRAPRTPQPMAYFYDLNTGDLIELPADTAGPVETGSGPYKGMPAGVRAHVYCYGPYREGTERFVGYLQAPTGAIPKGQWPPGVELDPETGEPEVLIRRPGDDQWCDPNGAEGLRIMEEIRSRGPEGKRLTYLRPIPR
jgi:hypothetical protein